MTATIATNVPDGPTIAIDPDAMARTIAARISAEAGTIAASWIARATKSPRGSAMTRPSAAGTKTSCAMSAWAAAAGMIATTIAAMGAIIAETSQLGGGRSDRDFNYDRGLFNRGGSSERDYNRGWRGYVGQRHASRMRQTATATATIAR